MTSHLASRMVPCALVALLSCLAGSLSGCASTAGTPTAPDLGPRSEHAIGTPREQDWANPWPLFQGIFDSNVSGVEAAIRDGVDVNTHDVLGRTPIILAAAHGPVQIAILLINAGADIHARNAAGQTALMFASQHGQAEIVTLLPDNGANPNADSNDGATPLLFACWQNHPGIAKTLLEHGADPNVVTDYGQTPLMIAASFADNSIVQALLDYGAEANQLHALRRAFQRECGGKVCRAS